MNRSATAIAGSNESSITSLPVVRRVASSAGRREQERRQANCVEDFDGGENRRNGNKNAAAGRVEKITISFEFAHGARTTSKPNPPG